VLFSFGWSAAPNMAATSFKALILVFYFLAICCEIPPTSTTIQSIVIIMGLAKKLSGFFLAHILVITVDFLSLDELQLLLW